MKQIISIAEDTDLNTIIYTLNAQYFTTNNRKHVHIVQHKTVGIDVKAMLSEAQVSIYGNATAAEPLDQSDGYNFMQVLHMWDSGIIDEEIRACKDELTRLAITEKLSCFTPSGIFQNSRQPGNLLYHSRFIGIDIYHRYNQHVENFDLLKAELAKVKNVALCAPLIFVKGFFVLIPIGNPTHHLVYAHSIEAAFKHLGINIDRTCRNVTRFKTLACDPEMYIADNAIVFNQYYTARKNPF